MKALGALDGEPLAAFLRQAPGESPAISSPLAHRTQHRAGSRIADAQPPPTCPHCPAPGDLADHIKRPIHGLGSRAPRWPGARYFECSIVPPEDALGRVKERLNQSPYASTARIGPPAEVSLSWCSGSPVHPRTLLPRQRPGLCQFPADEIKIQGAQLVPFRIVGIGGFDRDESAA